MVKKRRGVPPVPPGGFGPTGMRRAAPPGTTPFDYRGTNVKNWPPGPETIRRLEELLRKLEAGGGGQDVINAIEAKITQLGGGGTRPPVTTPPPTIRAAVRSQSPSPNTIQRARPGPNQSLIAQAKVQASPRVKAAWEKLLTPGEHLEVQAGVQRHLRSLKPQQLQMFHPAGELKGVTPNDWLAGIGTGNPARAMTTGSIPTGQARPESVWQSKLWESKRPFGQGHGSGLWESIKAEGVRDPVELGHQPGGLPRRIMEGHHRVAAAADINPAMEVPVTNRPYGIYGQRVALPDRRIKQIVPNEDIVKQLTKFSRKWGRNALRMMMKIPK